MHELLVQKYIDQAREYVKTDRWPGAREPQWTELVDVMLTLADECLRLRRKQARIVESYDKEQCARTGDFHMPSCECLRCAVDEVRA